MRFLTILAVLVVGCETPKPAKDSAETGDSDDSAVVETKYHYDITAGKTDGEFYWVAGVAPFGGYAGVAGERGFYVSDPVGDGVTAYVHRIPWGSADSSADFIEDIADVTVTTQFYGPDKLGFNKLTGDLSIPNAAGTADGIEAAGIAYSMEEPSADGELSSLSEYAFGGGFEDGYTGRTLRLDADGDGDIDDMLATATNLEGDSYGSVAVWLDVEPGYHSWDSADFSFLACEDEDDTKIKYGPVDVTLDANGETLYVACPSGTYHDGSVETYAMPLSAESYREGYLYGISGWTVNADPSGGAWAGSQGSGSIGYVNADLSYAFGAYPASMVDFDYFGADPQLLRTSGGQTLLLVGQQTRTAETPELLAPVSRPVGLPSTFDPGEAGKAADERTDTSAVWLCDVTEAPVPDEATHYALLTCQDYRAGSIGCVGAVQGIREVDGVVYAYSAGWEFGSGDGCGVLALSVEGVEVE